MAELLTNPDHRRSRLVRLTDRGRDQIEAMWRRETQLVTDLPLTSSDDEVDTAVRVLQELRQLLPEGQPAAKEWIDDGIE